MIPPLLNSAHDGSNGNDCATFNTSINLPIEIICRILSFLPPLSCLALKRLCKTLDKHISSASFAFQNLSCILPNNIRSRNTVEKPFEEWDALYFQLPDTYQRSYNLICWKHLKRWVWTSPESVEESGVCLMTVIPKSIGLLTHLTHLILENCGLVDILPIELMHLTNLRVLSLCDNALTGHIPDELGDLVNLEKLNFGCNSIEGPIPATIASLTNLTHLLLHNNRLTSLIPKCIGHLVQLREVYLYNNQLSGRIPRELRHLVHLIRIHADNNHLTGPVPVEMIEFEYLEECDFRNNNGVYCTQYFQQLRY
ncbi:L domain-like protein [Rhizoclosmatium globosum]|uniref:L domain-like protein n=1 Tax=Rhizoclosmatium globosum TaxID=329046 RepID=A0A1Y2C3W4_9FUNG|nr:L domain-like protein [Rhizoclosmatium globosum]|eukprot:ORY40995.1 L domain-like protein [Rhizoclosmatium globosum]